VLSLFDVEKHPVPFEGKIDKPLYFSLGVPLLDNLVGICRIIGTLILVRRQSMIIMHAQRLVTRFRPVRRTTTALTFSKYFIYEFSS